MKDNLVNTIKIDANGKVLGKVAAEAAIILRGKNKPCFSHEKFCGDKVIIINANKVIITGKKLLNEKYYSHSGYLGNLKTKKMKDLFNDNPEQVIYKAIYGMLPRNKLRKIYLKNLNIKKEE